MHVLTGAPEGPGGPRGPMGPCKRNTMHKLSYCHRIIKNVVSLIKSLTFKGAEKLYIFYYAKLHFVLIRFEKNKKMYL